jgi:hypothetical protein
MFLDSRIADLPVRLPRFQRPLPYGAMGLWVAAVVPGLAALGPHRVVWFSGAVAVGLALCGFAVATGRPERCGHVLLWVSLMVLLLMTFWPGAAGPQREMLSAVLVLGVAGAGIVHRNESRRTGPPRQG